MKSIDNESEREKLEKLFSKAQASPRKMQRIHPELRDTELEDDYYFEPDRQEKHSRQSKRRLPRGFEPGEEGNWNQKKSSCLKSIFWGLAASTLFLGGGYLANPENQIYKTSPFTVPTTIPVQWQFEQSPRLMGAELVHKQMQEGQINAPKSTITGIVDSNTMTASLYWTMVLKNNNSTDKEARISMNLPKNSALSRATLWVNGVAQEAAFSAREDVQRAYDRIVVQHRDPLLITQTGPNQIKILAAPVTANGGEMQLRIGLTVPVERTENGRFKLCMPNVEESNLKFDSRQDIHLSSDTPLSGVGRTEESGIFLLRANIPVNELNRTEIAVSGPTTDKFATRLTHTNPTEYVVAELKEGRLQLTRVDKKPDCKFISDEDAAFRLSSLWAYREIERLASHGDQFQACRLANIYRIVSSVSGAAVLELESDYSASGLDRKMYQVMSKDNLQHSPNYISRKSVSARRSRAEFFSAGSASGGSSARLSPVAPSAPVPAPFPTPQFSSNSSVALSEISFGDADSLELQQAATNGSIGPMGGDATVIQGVNTAGTVRVNNLANLEQLLSVLASVIQIAGIGVAVFLGSEALQKGELKLGKLNLTKSKGLAAALVLAAAAACSPQFVNWLVASLRDANIFS